VKLWDAKLPARPRTDDWPVNFRDDFNRAQPGERWEVLSGQWTIEQGALRGELQQAPEFPAGVHSAILRLREPRLPATVELRFDCWPPDPLLPSGALANDEQTHAQSGVLMGSPNPALANGGQGTGIFLQSGKNVYQPVGVSSKAELKPNTRSRVRILHEPR